MADTAIAPDGSGEDAATLPDAASDAAADNGPDAATPTDAIADADDAVVTDLPPADGGPETTPADTVDASPDTVIDPPKPGLAAPCDTDDDCAGAGTGKKCDLASHSCVLCLTSKDCVAGELCQAKACKLSKTCKSDTDCKATNQVCDKVEAVCADCASDLDCDKGKCHDPNRFCRQRSVVMFTDGIDTASEGAWVAPSIQAKRFRYGLDCKTDQDCGKGATCASSGTCQPASEALDPCKRLGFSCHIEHEDRTFPKAFAAGFTRLRDRLGAPIRITVHVVDATGAIGYENATVAAYGGGLLVPADLASPADLLKGIRGVIDWKDANFCDPE